MNARYPVVASLVVSLLACGKRDTSFDAGAAVTPPAVVEPTAPTAPDPAQPLAPLATHPGALPAHPAIRLGDGGLALPDAAALVPGSAPTAFPFAVPSGLPSAFPMGIPSGLPTALPSGFTMPPLPSGFPIAMPQLPAPPK